MKNKNIQTLIQKWIKIYDKRKDEELIELYQEDFEGKSTPRRDEDKARRDALIALIGDKLTKQVHTKGEWKEKEGEVFIQYENGMKARIATCTAYKNLISSDESEANAQRIVKAVNMHDELIKALEPFAKLAEQCLNNTNLNSHQDIYAYNKAKITMDDLRFVQILFKQAEQK